MVEPDEFVGTLYNTKFTFCEQCFYWKRIGEDPLNRCLRNAPSPEINNGLSSLAQEVVWPATQAGQGCFGGLSIAENED